VRRLLVSANVVPSKELRLLGCYAILHSHRSENLKSYIVPSSSIFVTLMMVLLGSSETLVPIRGTWYKHPLKQHYS
jgi:hypothetical protein